MPFEVRAGDLFADATLPALAHGCNCAGSMGRGIAVEFRKRWPEMYEAYKAKCQAGEFRPGDVFAWTAPGRTIFNLATQPVPRPSARLEYIDAALTSAVRIAESRSIPLIAMPRVGAGYGGLEWEAVREVIEEIGRRTEMQLVVYERVSDSPGRSIGGLRSRRLPTR